MMLFSKILSDLIISRIIFFFDTLALSVAGFQVISSKFYNLNTIKDHHKTLRLKGAVSPSFSITVRIQKTPPCPERWKANEWSMLLIKKMAILLHRNYR